MPSKPKKVLFFEDDYESLQDLKEYLERYRRWEVELSAQEHIADRLAHERFDLILVDLMIPPEGLDASGQLVQNVHFDGVSWLKTGLEFLRRLRGGEFRGETGYGTPSDVPVIVLSAVANYSVENALPNQLAVTDYVEKPFLVEDILRRMDRLLQE
jgi:CheY-like chemotaxis protein